MVLMITQLSSVKGTRFNAQSLNKVVPYSMHYIQIIIVVVMLGALKIYVAAVEALKKN
jgi:hypothetical protein